MTTEKFANKPVTTLNGAIDGLVLTLVVASALEFPSTPQFRILIDNELLLVTGVSGTTFTVTREVEGTTAAPHSNGAAVTHVLTAGALAKLKLDVIDQTDLPTTTAPGSSGGSGSSGLASDAGHTHPCTSYGTTSDTICQGDDSRLGDDRVSSGIRTATTVVVVSSAAAPVLGQVLTATSGTAADWETPASSTTLVTVSFDIDLTTSANTAIDTRPSSPTGPGRWKLVSIDLRLKVALTGSGTPSSVVSIGSTLGGTQIVLAQTVLAGTTVGSIVGGFSLTSLGSDMSQSTGFEAMYAAGQVIYANVTAVTASTGTLTAYLLWQELP